MTSITLIVGIKISLEKLFDSPTQLVLESVIAGILHFQHLSQATLRVLWIAMGRNVDFIVD